MTHSWAAMHLLSFFVQLTTKILMKQIQVRQLNTKKIQAHHPSMVHRYHQQTYQPQAAISFIEGLKSSSVKPELCVITAGTSWEKAGYVLVCTHFVQPWRRYSSSCLLLSTGSPEVGVSHRPAPPTGRRNLRWSSWPAGVLATTVLCCVFQTLESIVCQLDNYRLIISMLMSYVMWSWIGTDWDLFHSVVMCPFTYRAGMIYNPIELQQQN